ncbi:type II toxin-antitoxin system death-on-curing family toxin [Chitiniphilus purpureus]|uniref:Type II toxin-antitoxin system death-on-curing family toxin n=1 Tax=Chitiniphilus purpureus TaxID=2981137 RepID=A0ABY6DRW5_9NEIS|nr:type II toxin-antitoxin system death-on-curing family toxin [Chitiniphilus sp. CD1]UXY16211.1 type II toxin-antitoxin system death-on-curing family toxin [Chitiniphilus sp. CD1]
MVWLPNSKAVEDIHIELAKIFEQENDPISPVGIKSQPMLESACERPNTGVGSHFKYTTLEHKLAALFHSLTKNHPFHNGNKRTAIVSLITALYRNNKRLDSTVSDETIYDFVVSVTADEFPKKDHGLHIDVVVDEIAKWIKKKSTPLNTKAQGMKIRGFIEKCKAAGAHCKNASGGAYVISNKSNSIRISKSTKQLSGPVIRQYLNKLALSETTAGISMDDFREGVSDEREQIYRYMVALRRLART